ncbi:DUF6033 family protein [Aneurinibacillus aneurinilyticus]|uniref:DUF6033 family protein n=1 Tax=Aneurinibacillus aneurinilyticus TaxID=1391 RepID=UPI003524EF57
MNLALFNNEIYPGTGASLRSLQQSTAVKESSHMASFDRVLSKVESDGIVDELTRKYGLSVTLESIPKDEKKMEKRIRNGNLSDVTIAPNIAEQMKTDPKLRAKVESDIDMYLKQDIPELQAHEGFGVSVVASGIIIHEDGSKTVWSACVTSPEEVEKGKRIEAEKQKEKEAKRARLEAAHHAQNWISVTLQTSSLRDARPFDNVSGSSNPLAALELARMLPTPNTRQLHNRVLEAIESE